MISTHKLNSFLLQNSLKAYILCGLFVAVCASTVSCGSAFKKDLQGSLSAEQKRYNSLALQGDVKSAISALNNKKKRSLAEMNLLVKYQDRFVKKIKPQLNVEDPFVVKVIEAYQDYWNEVLTKELNQREGFYLLFKNLNKVMRLGGGQVTVYDDQRLEELIQKVKEELKARGYHSLMGMTRPHLELMIWKKQKEKTYKVRLHDGVQKVKVVLLDKFESLGWSAYATFGKSYTGGWATKEKLFCVRPAYKLRSENYKVSYLKHEARHFADYKLFPNMKQPELEYRAKLTELYYAKKTQPSLVEKFKTQGENSRVSPHAWANYHVYQNLMTETGGETNKEKSVKRAALQLLNKK